MVEEMGKEEINEWTDGPWDCVCGEVKIYGSFGCPSCGLTVMGSNMERRKRDRDKWAAIAEDVNNAIKNDRLRELMIMRDKMNEAIEDMQMRGIE